VVDTVSEVNSNCPYDPAHTPYGGGGGERENVVSLTKTR